MTRKARVESPAPRVGKSDRSIVLGVHVNAGLEIVPVVFAVVIMSVLDCVNVAAHILGRVDRFERRKGAHSPPPHEKPQRRRAEREGHHSAAADGSQEPGLAALDVGRQFHGLRRGERPPF